MRMTSKDLARKKDEVIAEKKRAQQRAKNAPAVAIAEIVLGYAAGTFIVNQLFKK